jgi:excisionase family DNA binding protein
MPDSSDEFMTVAEVAAILRMNPQTIRNRIDRGELAAVHVGRRVRVLRADFDAISGAGYRGGPAGRSQPSIWDGEIPMPETPSER